MAATAAAASSHAHDGLPLSDVLPMHEAILASSPLGQSTKQTQRHESRRLGALHSKGNVKGQSSEDDADNIVPMSAVIEEEADDEEEDPMQFVLLGSNTASVTTSTTANSITVQEYEPATVLTPYTRIGGSSSFVAKSDRYPYMASLQIEGVSNAGGKFDYHMCGGFLIAPDLVMTSAHCADYKPPGSDETFQAFNGIEVGRANLGKEVAYDPHDLHTYRLDYENLIPEKLIKHPQYNEMTYEHDLMIVKIFGRSRYTPVKIDMEAVAGGQEVTVLGWGATTNANGGKKYSDQLREADLLVLDNQSCKSTQVEVTNPTTGSATTTTLEDNISSDMMCAMARNRYICHGDGGGPAIRRGDTPEEDRVTGIVSWGYGCVNPDYPAVMTRTADHEQWIRTIVCKESTDPPAEYGCPGGMTLNSATSSAKQTVTLKLKLDKMAVETGFVIVTHPQPSVVAQRVPGYYKIKGNEIVEEQMNLPSNQCYTITLLDSFGDGFCCDMGGGSGTLYLGTDTGYYSGRVLVEVNGNFDYDSSGEFCLDSSSSVSAPEEGKSAVISSGGGSSSSSSGSLSISSGSKGSSNGSGSNSSNGSGSNNVSSDSGNNQGSSSDSGSGWSGPVTSPAFGYCNKFCIDNKKALNCESYTCYHSGASETDSQGNVSSGGQGNGGGTGSSNKDEDEFDPTGHASDPGEYYLTVQFKFDKHPQDVSWVLYDLTANEVRMFVDFEAYKEEEFAGEKLEVVVNVEGPDAGEKQYAFTVYDKSSDGLCCDNGRGWYKLFLGDVEDDMKLLGDAKYEFSSSYYFTLFEEEKEDVEGAMTVNSSEKEVTNEPTRKPSSRPSSEPTKRPTPSPTIRPSVSPTQSPSQSPTTPRPTQPWEVKRSELLDEIGARWNTATVIPPEGKFNDIGGDPRNFDFTEDLQRSDGITRRGFGLLAVALLSCCLALLQ